MTPAPPPHMVAAYQAAAAGVDELDAVWELWLYEMSLASYIEEYDHRDRPTVATCGTDWAYHTAWHCELLLQQIPAALEIADNARRMLHDLGAGLRVTVGGEIRRHPLTSAEVDSAVDILRLLLTSNADVR